MLYSCYYQRYLGQKVTLGVYEYFVSWKNTLDDYKKNKYNKNQVHKQNVMKRKLTVTVLQRAGGWCEPVNRQKVPPWSGW